MYPFSIRSSIPLRSNVDREELHELLMEGVCRRKVNRVSRNLYRIEPLRHSYFREETFSTLVNEIAIGETHIECSSTSPVAGFLALGGAVLGFAFVFYEGTVNSDWSIWNVIITMGFVLLAPSIYYLPYRNDINAMKEMNHKIQKYLDT